MSTRGNISKWNDEKSFGFIAPGTGGSPVFVHIKALPRGARRPQVGDEVIFEVTTDAQGRARADKVRFAGETPSFGPALKAFVVGSAFLALVAALAVYGKLPLVVLWLYLGMSVLSLGLYALDKSAARKGGQRVPENTLHLFSFLGGWPGALYAQQLLRHKSSKASFRMVFWITLSGNVSALSYLLLPYGALLRAMLRQIAT